MTENRSNPLWNIFKSIKLTLALLIIIAVTSIVGTLIPQQEGALGFARALSPAITSILNTLQLFDMYHSVWFRLIICILSINLIVCSIDRFPATLKRFNAKPRPGRSKPFEDLPEGRSLAISGQKKDISSRVAEIIDKQYKRVQSENSDNGDFIYGEKGRFSLFGVYLVHFSVLFILAGAIIGSLFGFEAYVNIDEGGTINSVTLRNSINHEHKNLGFDVSCNKFSVDFYENGMPREYVSELAFSINGKTVKESTLKVNHPATFNGIRFYQSSYGSIPGGKVGIKITSSGDAQNNLVLALEAGEKYQLPDNDSQITVTDIKEDFMRMGPAVQVTIMSPEKDDTQMWLFSNIELIKARMPGMFEQFPALNPSAFSPYTFYLTSIESRYYTGLQVNKDPGIAFVYTGFLMIIIGLYITFFTAHRRIWVRITIEKDKTRISVAGVTSKNLIGLEKELDQLVIKLKTELNNERIA